MKEFREDFRFFLNKLEDWENFTFARFSDGELFMLQNKKVVLAEGLTQVGETLHGCHYSREDHKEFLPGEHEFYRARLEDALRYEAEGYYKGICCPCCVGVENYQWMKSRAGERISWSNLWMNSNYPLFVEKFLPALADRDVCLVCNENADVSGLPFVLVKDWRVGFNCQVNDYGLISEIADWIGDNEIEDHVFLFSAASLSEFLCHQLHEKFPENTYVDVGTALNRHLGLSVERGYLKGYWGGSGHPDLSKVCTK